jgi:hypothetical protein
MTLKKPSSGWNFRVEAASITTRVFAETACSLLCGYILGSVRVSTPCRLDGGSRTSESVRAEPIRRQNRTFAPSWIWRASCARTMRPAFALVRSPTGRKKFAVLNALKISILNWMAAARTLRFL